MLHDVFGADELAPIVTEIDGFEAELEGLLRQVDGERVAIAEAGAIAFTTHLVKKSERLRAFAAHPVFARLCADLIGPDANLYWDQAVYKKPEKPRRFPWHQDSDPDDVAVAEVGAGGIVVFSSLTPHLTGPNTTDAVRKAYILQYAPDGATILEGDPWSDQPPTPKTADDPERQFPIIRGGKPVSR